MPEAVAKDELRLLRNPAQDPDQPALRPLS
jgi:hypothetical protein